MFVTFVHIYMVYPKYLLVCCFLYIKVILSLRPFVLPFVLPTKSLEKTFKDFHGISCVAVY
jgi:hypothetical protein